MRDGFKWASKNIIRRYLWWQVYIVFWDGDEKVSWTNIARRSHGGFLGPWKGIMDQHCVPFLWRKPAMYNHCVPFLRRSDGWLRTIITCRSAATSSASSDSSWDHKQENMDQHCVLLWWQRAMHDHCTPFQYTEMCGYGRSNFHFLSLSVSILGCLSPA